MEEAGRVETEEQRKGEKERTEGAHWVGIERMVRDGKRVA